jgi:menaquinone-9 beta-reductase
MGAADRMSKAVDVFVVGGGPAGLVAAIAARQQGLSVMLADGADHPIDKPCGEGLVPETLAALGKLGIQIPQPEGFAFRGIRFLQAGSQVSADYGKGHGLGIRRTVLHELLVAKAKENGVEMCWKTPVTGIEKACVKLKQESISARWIVGADGSGSRVRRWSGLDATRSNHQRFAIRRHYRVRPWSEYMEIHWGAREQAYVTPISQEEICVVVLAEKSQDANFAESFDSWPELKTRLDKAELGSRERGAITAMHSLKKVYRGNVALVGDASGSVDAITGEGLRLAFGQAIALAEGMKRGDLREYQRLHHLLARRPTWLGNLLLLMGRNASFRQRALKSLAANPELFTDLLAIHAGYSTMPAILATSARVSWEFLAA